MAVRWAIQPEPPKPFLILWRLRPCPPGFRVTVRRVVSWYKRGLSPEEIGDRIGYLTLAEVYAALTYYHANTAEIEADIAQQVAEAQHFETHHQSVQ
ncbi:MAG: DUF433 domain-containing protein [Lyngbya sp. HA4199-MV5]|nr:DUF433 domain-containing protein [Lyngbya sp. HA4199-MV5]